MNTPILQTKLYIPQPQSDLVPRGRLIESLDSGLARQLNLVCAPAGYGKTTLVTTWLAGVKQKVEQQVAWLSLDELDNEPGRYLAYVVAAIRTVYPDFGDGTSALLNSAQPQPPEAIIATLVNELAAIASPLILVLDDFHVLTEPSIHTGLERMLPYLPPHVHLVITSRTEPEINLTRLRVRNQVNEVGVQALRFTSDEAVAFVNQRMGLTLSAEDINELEERTEGWAAGLQLAALTLQNSPQNSSVADMIRSHSGSNRHLVDYFTHEIVSAQPADLQQFLLSTSILNRMCADLCHAMTGRADGQMILEDLERRNLFLIPLDSERRWYRYHHLFGDLLQQMLVQQEGDEAVAALHLRASRWFEQNGYVDESIDHAIKAGKPERAAQLLDGIADDLMLKQGAFAQVRNWLDKIPIACTEAYPTVMIAGLFSHFIAHDLVGAMPYFEALRSAEDLPETAQGLLASAEANLMFIKGEHEAAKEHLRQALHAISEDNLIAGVMIRMQMGSALIHEEDLRGAYRLWVESSELAELNGDTFSQLMAMRWTAGTLHACGKLRRAKQILDEALTIASAQSSSPLPIAGDMHVGLSALYYEWNQLVQAAYHCEIALKLSEHSGSGDALQGARIQQIKIAFARNQTDAAISTLRDLKQLAQQVSGQVEVPVELRYYPVFEAQMFTRAGELARAAEWFERAPIDPTEMPAKVDGAHGGHIEYWVTKAWVEQEPSGLEKFDPLLSYLIDLADEREYQDVAIWLRCLYAISLHIRQQTELAVDTFCAALVAAQPEGYIRTFVDQGEPVRELLHLAQARKVLPDYVATLLAAYDSSEQATVAEDDTHESGLKSNPLMESLTTREDEILALVAAGLTNQEIAERLIISIGTVKRHVSNIFGKLGASHRAQAIALASEFGLLG